MTYLHNIPNIKMLSTSSSSYSQTRRVKPILALVPHRSTVHGVLQYGHTRINRKSAFRSSQRRLSTPILNNLDDTISIEQLPQLNHPAVEYLEMAPNGTLERTDQIASLRYPRMCVDSDGDFVDRFVLDNVKSSGRVYDRLCRREVPRLIPYLNAKVPRQIYDVWEDRMRTRTLMDDLRDISARKCLNITDHERHCKYFSAQGIRFSDEESTGSEESESGISDGYSYDADSEMSL